MTQPNDIIAAYERHAKAQSEANRVNKATLFEILAAAQITTVNAEFDGEGDSGQINDIIAYSGDALVPLPTLPVTLQQASCQTGDLKPHQSNLYEAIETLCYDYLSQEHGGWEDNDGAFGEFTFDVAERKIELEFNGRFSDSTLFTHSF